MMPAGRPPKWESPEQLQKLIDDYFANAEKPKMIDGAVWFEPITVTGLALALDTTRETLCKYEKNDEFTDTLKRAKLRVEHYAEKQLYLGKSATGPIFALKNFGWRDQQDVNHGGQSDAPAIKTENKVVVEFVSAKPVDNA